MSKRILVVDDEVEVTRLLKLYLESEGGYDVREENDSRGALAAARAFRPDLILLDLMMPPPDGSELAAKFKNDPVLKQVPVLFLTALVSRATCCGPRFGLGVGQYLPKPIDFRELMRFIANCDRRPEPAR